MKYQEVKKIEAYSVNELVFEVERYVNQGYKVGTDNDNFPISYGTMYTVGMVKSTKENKESKEPKESKPKE